METIDELEREILQLRQTLSKKENQLNELKNQLRKNLTTQELVLNQEQYNKIANFTTGVLPKWAIERYSRQILLGDIGVEGQRLLCGARVLVVGAGGLGCPAAPYLAGAGVGEIGIVDFDTVDLTNIHRQILHGECDQNVSKVESAAEKLRRMNSRIKVTPYNIQLESSNAMEIVSRYDVVLDCTDNVPTRYLLNDVCVAAKRPLISGSALKMEGQLTIYGYREAARWVKKESATYVGPCYRCVFPRPPPAAAVGSCSADGVAGPVPAVIGVLQALEAIKYIVGAPREKLLVERMLLFDGEDITFRTVRLRSRGASCDACGPAAVAPRADYEELCQARVRDKGLNLQILPPENRISAEQLNARLRHEPSSLDSISGQRHLLVDVRSEQEFRMCNIDGSVNCPLDALRERTLDELLAKIRNSAGNVTFVCRQGNDSQIAARRVMDALGDNSARITDLHGGLHAWSKYVDHEFPVY